MSVTSHFNGKFITFEGIEGVGKTTNINFIAKFLRAQNVKLIVTREPGGTPIAENLRNILLKNHEERVTSETEMLLLFAGRSQHIHNIIRPTLKSGICVLCDRFSDATYAYQGGGRGIDIKYIESLEKMIQGSFRPDLTILFDVSVEVGLRRTRNRSSNDRFEQEKLAFFERVRSTYLKRAVKYSKRYRVINVDRSLTDIQNNLRQVFSCYE